MLISEIVVSKYLYLVGLLNSVLNSQNDSDGG